MQPTETVNHLIDILRNMSRQQASAADLLALLPRHPDTTRLEREALALGRQIARTQRAALDLRDTLETQDLD